ncbi:helix-turn-helix domain-containing protein [Paenibacillus sp. J2TS4]|uniref:helix-turn-helix domain-containing protein n=1 Tax=Paenibacillus sp. J2TS4 TaxID=2807194 RepID=UPI001B0C4DDF|nr:helix-turn-helix domain-containing protein [Paenibacillus sp. J2TS4]GIP33659.1 putative HTH-type transcriptional regulator YtdP [Paenibacillus sp. J2TS4]
MTKKGLPIVWRGSGRQSVFITLLSSYIIILLIPVIIGSALYQSVEKLMVDNANRANLGMLEQVKQVMDNRLREVDSITMQLALNPKLLWLLGNVGADTVNDQVKFLEFMKEVKNFRNVSSFIEDFLIYFKGSDTILTPLMKTSPDVYFNRIRSYNDKDYDWVMDELLSGYRNKTYFPVTPITDVVDSRKANYITYVQSLPLNSYSDPDGYLVIYINEQEINQLLKQVEWVNNGAIYIMDENQQILMTNSNEYEIDPEIYTRLTQQSDDYNLQIGEKMLSYTTSAKNGWKYVSIVPKGIVMERVNEVKNWALTMLVVCLVAGVIVSYVMAYRNYSPIRELIQAIAKGKGIYKGNFANEYDFIKKTIVHSLDEEKNLRRTLEEHAPVLQANFLTRLIKGHAEIEAAKDSSLEFMGIHFKHNFFYTIIFDIDDCSCFIKGDTEREWALVRFILTNVCSDLLQDEGYIVEMDRNRLAVLASIPEADEEAKLRRKEFTRELKQVIKERFRIKTTVAVSSIQQGMEEIGRCYREALMALDYRIIYGANEVIHYEDIEDLEQHYYHYPMEAEVQLMNYAKSGDYAHAEKLLDQIYEVNFLNHGITPEMGRCLFFDLLSTVLKVLNGMNIDDKKLFPGSSDPAKAISDCSTAEEMLGKTKELYREICAHAKEEKTDRSERLYTNISRYIEQNSLDANISLTAMAEHFQMTPQYLSSFFKKYSGVNVSDYIATVRIRESKALLADRTLTVSQIAQRVGYSNDVGFIRFFKKYEGVTPGKYREMLEQ